MERPAIDKASPVTGDQYGDDAFATILRYNFEYMLAWEALAHEGSDIEGVHQVRVAYRRMRSALALFGKMVPRELTRQVGEEMRWAASELGPARDLDVFIDEALEPMLGKIPLAPGEAKMLAVAKEARAAAYDRVRAMIDSDRYRSFKDDFIRWLDDKAWFQADLPAPVRQAMRRPITPFASKVLGKRLAKVLEAGADFENLSVSELHQLRIEGKKLRYATEFFTPLFPKKSMADFNVHLKGMQGLLGIMNDVSVMHTLLDGLLEGRDDPDLLQYAGALIGWRARQYEEVRGQLKEQWALLEESAMPWQRKA